ncbi:phage minor head protein [Peptoniphilus duerdenii]|uniref:phage minor head protein n=1 Tax=Peptoniphilus duerdenii TaxID=507750 RepID=UPI00288963CB|nr:phage minor head protein [Peptoniphilus duerdenii]
MKNNPFEDLSNSVEKLIKKRENGTKQNYKESYRRLRNKLQKIYADNESDQAPTLNRNELAKLDNETAKIIISMYKNNKKAIENTLKDVIDTSYKTVNSSVAKYNIEAVSRAIDSNKIIEKQVAGHIWTDRINKYGNDFVYDVHGIIHKGINDGDTFTSMARNLKKRFGKDIGNTVRIARTEGARVLEDSKYQAFEDIAENESLQVFKVWHTMGDEAVRDTHQAMEGIKVPYDDEFTLPSGATCLYPKSTGIAAEDINCRCYVEYVTEVVYNKSVEEIARINGYDPLESSKVVNTLRNDSKEWVDKLNDYEKKSINKYTYNDIDKDGKRLFEKINGYLEGRYKPIDKKEEIMLLNNASNISDGLLENTLKHDIIVYRNDIDPGNLGGNVKKFLSTSVAEKGTTGTKPNVAIIVPKGANGAYIENLADDKFKKQREFLLNKDTVLKKLCTNEKAVIYVVR